MSQLYMSLFLVLLFVLLTPGVLVTLPSKGYSKLTVALVHGVAFAVLYSLLHKSVWSYLYEGFTGVAAAPPPACPAGQKRNAAGVCE